MHLLMSSYSINTMRVPVQFHKTVSFKFLALFPWIYLLILRVLSETPSPYSQLCVIGRFFPVTAVRKSSKYTREDWVPRGPKSSSFWVPRNLSNHMDRQARIGYTVLVKRREVTGRTQTLPWWLGGGRVKTTENKIHFPRWSILTTTYKSLAVSVFRITGGFL
jgi:hypothetical protein